jgi:transcriptional regulator with XRE-family HTH domain
MTSSRKETSIPPSDEVKARLGANLRNSRERLGISQHEVAFRAGLHYTTTSSYELGKNAPTIGSFIRLAGALEVTADELAEGMIWVPPVKIIRPGAFDVPDDPDLSAEVARLRADLGLVIAIENGQRR